jgi:hypothetical protein
MATLAAAVTATLEGATVTQESVTGSEQEVTITGLEIVLPETATIAVPTLVIANPMSRPEGGLTASAMTFDGGTVTAQGYTLTWADGSMQNVTVPGAQEASEEEDADTRFVPFSEMQLATISASSETFGFPINIATIQAAFSQPAENAPDDISASVAGLVLPLDAFAFNARLHEMVEQLGYEAFTIGMTFNGNYQPDSDTLTVQAASVRADEAGELTVNTVITDFPAGNVLKGFDMAENALSGAKLASATLTFANQGIVDRALEAQARSTGSTRQQFATGMSMALPLMLNVIGNRGFQDELAPPLGAFLMEPRTITFTASPPEPVPIMAILGAAITGFSTLPDLMAIDVRANE